MYFVSSLLSQYLLYLQRAPIQDIKRSRCRSSLRFPTRLHWHWLLFTIANCPRALGSLRRTVTACIYVR